MVFKALGVALVIAAMGAAPAASAKVMQLTITGTGVDLGPDVGTSADYGHVFGPGDWDSFAGVPVTLNILYDTSISHISNLPYWDAVCGGPSLGYCTLGNPFVSATMTANNITIGLTLDIGGYLELDNGPATASYQLAAYGGTGGYNDYLFLQALGLGGVGGTLETPFEWTGFCGNCGTAQFNGFSHTIGSYTQLDITGIRISDPAAVTAQVPEPAAWALMIAGFGLVGSALRRRRSLAVA